MREVIDEVEVDEEEELTEEEIEVLRLEEINARDHARVKKMRGMNCENRAGHDMKHAYIELYGAMLNYTDGMKYTASDLQRVVKLRRLLALMYRRIFDSDIDTPLPGYRHS